jgi:exosortase
MTEVGETAAATLPKASRLSWQWLAYWVGLASLAAPTLLANARQSWSGEQGQQAPFVLVIGIWLLYRNWPAMWRAAAPPRATLIVAALGLLSATVYLFGRIADQFEIETYALYAIAVVGLYALLGRGLARGRFAIAYLGFALPAPYMLTWFLTNHLRLWVTEAAVATYRTLGYLVVRNGLDILIDQYDLAVRDACSGMNSLISLSAIGLVYVHLRRAPPLQYYAIMAVPIVAFAIMGNFIRVLVLIGLTHYFGDAVGQGFLHVGAGLVTFMVALFGVIATDAAVGTIGWKFSHGGAQ